MQNILVTGGAGFIGSHTCVNLLLKGYKVIILDSYENSSELILKKLRLLIQKIDNNLLGNLSFYSEDYGLIAFDTGPANAPLNDWIKFFNAGDMDVNGTIAATGIVDENKLEKILEELLGLTIHLYRRYSNYVRG